MSRCTQGFTDNVHGTPGAAGWLYECPNMKPVEGDRSMTHEHYRCAVCGERTKLDYDEMR